MKVDNQQLEAEEASFQKVVAAMKEVGDGSLANKLQVDLAIKRTYQNVLRNVFPNRLDAAILKSFPGDIGARVTDLLSDRSLDWANGAAHYFDLPRRGGLVRQLCYLDVDVRVIYQALVDEVARQIEPYIEAKFVDRIISHRVRSAQSEIMFRDPREAYSRFIELQHDQARSGVFKYCVKLDVANYYDRIYMHKLQQLLDRRGVQGEVTSALCMLLRKFALGDSHGIPQGLWPSDYLGNIYLLHVDEYLAGNEIHGIRYVDDYRIFCNSETDAKRVLKSCCAVLREIGLSPQASKTGIVAIEKLNPELKPLTESFLNLRTEKVKIVVRELQLLSMGQEVVAAESEEWGEQQNSTALSDDDIRDFERLWTEAVDQDDKRSSILEFALAGLSAGGSATAEQYVLDHLGEFPNLASAVSKYLKSLGFKLETAERVITFAESDDCIEEWQQIWLLEYLKEAGAEFEAFRGRIRTIMQDGRRHVLVRALAAEILADLGNDTDGEEIRRLFSDQTDPRLRRSLLYGFKLLPVTERNYAISYLPPGDWNLKLVGQLLKAERVI